MTELSLPQVGFDRFIAYAWLEYALDLAIKEPNDDERRRVLKSWLQTQMDGVDAARKTYNLLARIWFVEYPQTAHLRAEALRIALEISQSDRIALHWGMCLANFHFFSDAISIAGRLIRLQGEFTLPVVQQRLAELYSNQGTIPRSAARIIQSLREWNIVIQQADGRYQPNSLLSIAHPDLPGFLVACALQHKTQQAWPLTDVLRLSEFFPFDVARNGSQAMRTSKLVDVHREGSNQEILMLRR